jgi:uncharacterized protein with HEPN domain
VSRRDPERLQDILIAIEAIAGHVAPGDLSDGLVFDAVRVRLIEIGEAVKALSPDLLDTEPGRPWTDIARMRDRLAHRYFDSQPGGWGRGERPRAPPPCGVFKPGCPPRKSDGPAKREAAHNLSACWWPDSEGSRSSSTIRSTTTSRMDRIRQGMQPGSSNSLTKSLARSTYDTRRDRGGRAKVPRWAALLGRVPVVAWKPLLLAGESRPS